MHKLAYQSEYMGCPICGQLLTKASTRNERLRPIEADPDRIWVCDNYKCICCQPKVRVLWDEDGRSNIDMYIPEEMFIDKCQSALNSKDRFFELLSLYGVVQVERSGHLMRIYLIRSEELHTLCCALSKEELEKLAAKDCMRAYIDIIFNFDIKEINIKGVFRPDSIFGETKIEIDGKHIQGNTVGLVAGLQKSIAFISEITEIKNDSKSQS